MACVLSSSWGCLCSLMKPKFHGSGWSALSDRPGWCAGKFASNRASLSPNVVTCRTSLQNFRYGAVSSNVCFCILALQHPISFMKLIHHTPFALDLCFTLSNLILQLSADIFKLVQVNNQVLSLISLSFFITLPLVSRIKELFPQVLD